MAKSILIAHECPLLREGLKHIIDQTNTYDLVACANAEEALSLSKGAKIDLVVTSFAIPKMGALELISRISAYSRPTKILVCANEVSLLVVEKCIQVIIIMQIN